MQRRAAAIYVVFFVVVAIAAYSLTTVAEEPSISLEGQNYSQGDPITAGGTQWTVNVSDGSGSVSSTNDSARFTTSFANNSSLRFQNGMYRPAPNGSEGGASEGTTAGTTSGAGTTSAGTASTTTGTTAGTDASGSGTAGTEFRVVIPNASGGNGSAANVSSFTLRQEFDTAARLQSDPAVADTTLTAANGTEYVQYRNGTTQRLNAYLPTPTTRNVSVGDRFPYQNNSSRVDAINTSGVTLAWRGSLTRSQELAPGENVTLGGTTYVALFPQNDTVTLSQNVSGYQAEQEALDHFHERILGLWGVVIISLFAAILVLALAYLPVRG